MQDTCKDTHGGQAVRLPLRRLQQKIRPVHKLEKSHPNPRQSQIEELDGAIQQRRPSAPAPIRKGRGDGRRSALHRLHRLNLTFLPLYIYIKRSERQRERERPQETKDCPIQNIKYKIANTRLQIQDWENRLTVGETVWSHRSYPTNFSNNFFSSAS